MYFFSKITRFIVHNCHKITNFAIYEVSDIIQI